MKTAQLIVVWIGLTIANFICAPTSEIAIERSSFQAIALLAVFITSK